MGAASSKIRPDFLAAATLFGGHVGAKAKRALTHGQCASKYNETDGERHGGVSVITLG